MGRVELLTTGEGRLKVVQHYDLRLLQQMKGLERHRAYRWPNFSRRASSPVMPLLKAMFLSILGLAGIRFYMEVYFGCFVWTFWLFLLVVTGMVPLALFIAVVVVWGVDEVTPKEKKTERQRKEEVETISGLIQQV